MRWRPQRRSAHRPSSHRHTSALSRCILLRMRPLLLCRGRTRADRAGRERIGDLMSRTDRARDHEVLRAGPIAEGRPSWAVWASVHASCRNTRNGAIRPGPTIIIGVPILAEEVRRALQENRHGVRSRGSIGQIRRADATRGCRPAGVPPADRHGQLHLAGPRPPARRDRGTAGVSGSSTFLPRFGSGAPNRRPGRAVRSTSRRSRARARSRHRRRRIGSGPPRRPPGRGHLADVVVTGQAPPATTSCRRRRRRFASRGSRLSTATSRRRRRNSATNTPSESPAA